MLKPVTPVLLSCPEDRVVSHLDLWRRVVVPQRRSQGEQRAETHRQRLVPVSYDVTGGYDTGGDAGGLGANVPVLPPQVQHAALSCRDVLWEKTIHINIPVSLSMPTLLELFEDIAKVK